MLITKNKLWNQKILRKTTKYEFENTNLYTGFNSVGEAKKFADERNGRLVEVGFWTETITWLKIILRILLQRINIIKLSQTGLQDLHSSDEGFQEIADKLKERQNEVTEKSPDEKYFSDSDPLIKEDGLLFYTKAKLKM
jgi:hypothetical protein